MLPKDETVLNYMSRSERWLAHILGKIFEGIFKAVARATVRPLFGSDDNREVRALNEEYEKIREFQIFMAENFSQQASNLRNLNGTVAVNTEDIKILEAKLDKNCTIIGDLETKMHQNSQDINL